MSPYRQRFISLLHNLAEFFRLWAIILSCEPATVEDYHAQHVKEGRLQPHNISVLKSRDQYPIWSSRTRSYLDGLDLLIHIEDDTPALVATNKDPLTEKDFSTATLKAWTRSDRRAISKLMPLVADDLVPLLESQPTAHAAWHKLREQMDGREGDNVLRRLNEVTNSRFDPSGPLSLRFHLTQLRQRMTVLRQILESPTNSQGGTRRNDIYDTILISAMLGSLPPSFETVVTTFMSWGRLL